MEKYIKDFCEEFQYPEEARQALLTGYITVMQEAEASKQFQIYLVAYNEDKLENYEEVFSTLDFVAKQSGVHTYTVQLLFFICLSKHLRKLYEDRGIAYRVYYDSMCDLKWKLNECYNMYGIWGSFVAFWFPEFFKMTRFALGRLQFELYHMSEAFTKDGYTVAPEEIVLNVHIPSCGALHHEDCEKSYQQATEFFKEYFVDRPTVFVCESWLLNPDHTEFLPSKSNILTFMKDYEIINVQVDKDGYDMWRLFNKEYHNNPQEMPCNSSLQKAYIDWLGAGNLVKCGFGIMIKYRE